jgi:LPXTG-site transpeptidase (sortase) family protein
MAYRRRSGLRTFLGLTTFIGLVVAAVAGVLALRTHLLEEPVILSTDAATDPDPPAPITDSATVDRTAPLTIRFDDVGIDDPIITVGLTEDGELEVPDETEVGWWEGGSAPGLPGATVLAAHVSWNRTAGPFNRLAQAELGSKFEVETGDGFIRTYQVVERALYGKDELPAERIWRTTGPEAIVLITCGGDYNPQIRRYRENIVVYAVPIAQRPADGFLGDEDEPTDSPERFERVTGESPSPTAS